MLEPLASARPPDLFALRTAPLARLLEALDELAAHAAGERGRQAIAVVADLALDESVRLIRRASRGEVVDAGEALARWCSGPRGRAVEAADPGSHAIVAGLMFVLAAAAAPDGKGGDVLVLRSWNGKAREAVELVAAAPDHTLARAELRRRLDVSESYLSHLLADLEAAGLVERIGVPGGRGVDVHLGGKGFALSSSSAASLDAGASVGEPPAVPSRPKSRRAVARVRAPALDGRLSRHRREGRALHAG